MAWECRVAVVDSLLEVEPRRNPTSASTNYLKQLAKVILPR